MTGIRLSREPMSVHVHLLSYVQSPSTPQLLNHSYIPMRYCAFHSTWVTFACSVNGIIHMHSMVWERFMEHANSSGVKSKVPETMCF